MSAFLGILALLSLAVAGIGALYAVSRLTAVAPDPLLSEPFLSGWTPEEHALSRYHFRWYPLAMIFLAFDVEMLFMYPWALVVAQVGAEAVIEMFIFLGVLLAGVLWAWREGALRWT